MAATLVAAVNTPASGESQATSRAVNKPAGAQIAVVWMCSWTGAGGGTLTPSGGSGSWTTRSDTTVGTNRTACFIKYVGDDATSTTYTFTYSGGSTWCHLSAHFFDDVDDGLTLSSVPFNTASAGSTGYATTTVTTVDGAALSWSGNTSGYSGTAPTHTPPTNFTETLDAPLATAAYRISPGDGSQSASDATTSVSVDNKISALVALEPVASGGDPVDLTDTPTGIRLGAPSVTLTIDDQPSVTIEDRPTGIRLSGPTTVDVTVSTTLLDTPFGVRLGGPSVTLTAEPAEPVDVDLLDRPTGMRLGGVQPRVLAGADVTLTDRVTGTRLGGWTVTVTASDTPPPPLVDLHFIPLAPELGHGPALGPEMTARLVLAPELGHGAAGEPVTVARTAGEPELGHGASGSPETTHGQPDHDLVHGATGAPTV